MWKHGMPSAPNKTPYGENSVKPGMRGEVTNISCTVPLAEKIGSGTKSCLPQRDAKMQRQHGVNCQPRSNACGAWLWCSCAGRPAMCRRW